MSSKALLLVVCRNEPLRILGGARMIVVDAELGLLVYFKIIPTYHPRRYRFWHLGKTIAIVKIKSDSERRSQWRLENSFTRLPLRFVKL